MKKDKIVIDGTTYVPEGTESKAKAETMEGKEYCIVRTYSAGVFAGYYDRKTEGKEATVHHARRIFYWDGAASLSQLANDGVKAPDNCKFTQVAEEVDLKEIIEVIPCTAEAKECIEGVAIWEM